MKTNLRLIVAVVTSLLDEALIVALIIWVLPQIGVSLPLPWLVAIVVGFGVFAAVTYRLGTRALAKKPLIGLSSMIDTTGKVACPLTPAGFVKIKGELWYARAENGEIDSGEEVVVVGQEKLKLIVRKKVLREKKR